MDWARCSEQNPPAPHPENEAAPPKPRPLDVTAESARGPQPASPRAVATTKEARRTIPVKLKQTRKSET